MNDDHMGDVATIVGDELAGKLEATIVKAVQHIRERLCGALDSTAIVYESLSSSVVDLPPELKAEVMLNLTEEYNGRLSCFLARVVTQVARQRCETDGQCIRHMLAHLDMTEAHGLPFKVMGFEPEKAAAAAAAETPVPATPRYVIVPLKNFSFEQQDEALHRASKKYSSNN